MWQWRIESLTLLELVFYWCTEYPSRHRIVKLFYVKYHKCQRFIRKTFNVPIGLLGSEGGGSGIGGIFRKHFSSCLILFVNFIEVN